MLKLAKLPDRTPVRIVLTVGPDLNRDLAAYAEAYRQAYGRTESIAELIPFMLDAFLASDRDFARLRKEGIAVPAPESRRARGPKPSITPVSEE
ncbi:DUF2274 domain-containing protein [Magnetospirillum sp. 15-1]|uniref:DUF2274 domain-containing protein n=1 Tax=Magnetospirillum sp. 15-1 TaxID=1979370 RepID=UPI000BBB7E16|nr:DUF2274 domain-containing protein [Magnetospirillum sp. 15-1]